MAFILLTFLERPKDHRQSKQCCVTSRVVNYFAILQSGTDLYRKGRPCGQK